MIETVWLGEEVPMARLAHFCLWAGSGDPRGAARAFLIEVSEGAVTRLLDAALWRDEDVLDFEQRQLGVLIDAKGGQRFWLASRFRRKALLPPAPRISPHGLVALARAVVEELAREEPATAVSGVRA